MIGTQTITLSKLPKLGDRDDFEARIVGPGDTDYTVPISLTGTVLAIWGENSEIAAKELIRVIFDVICTAGAPPEGGFWFDSYNSLETVKDTGNKIRNFGVAQFTKGGLRNAFVRSIGETLFEQKDKVDAFFVANFGFEFFRSFEDAFEDSRAIDDLSTQPRDHANFIYRICILSGFIDHFSVRLPTEKSETSSLVAFRSWLTDKLDSLRATRLTETFRMIKNLRKQYPIHEHFDIDVKSGVRTQREVVRQAEAYFGFRGSFEQDWLTVFRRFEESFSEILSELKPTP